MKPERRKIRKMEKKRRRLAKVRKKRGRPNKIRKEKAEEEEEEGDFESNSSDGDGDSMIQPTGPNGNTSSPELASVSLDTPTVSRCQTRYAKALADKKSALNSSSRIPFQNDDGNPSETSTLLLVKQILFDENRLDAPSNVPVEALPSKSPVQAQDLHSQHENICPDKTIGAQDGMNVSSKAENQPVPWNNALDLKTFTSDLLAQTQQPELPFQRPSCLDEIMVNNDLPERDANELISELGNPFVDVDEYKVKKETAPLLKAIFRKYGDIAKESTFSMESRSCLLELVCSIYKRLEASKFMQLTPLELQSMLGQIGDLELVKVEVGWLHKRLNQISKATQLYEGVSTLKDVEARTVLVIDEKQKAVQTYEKELEAGKAAVKKLQERLQNEKDELAETLSVVDEIKNFYDGSLVHGLI